MRKLWSVALALGLMGVGAAPALAHVTIQPNEAVIGTFSRFVVRVPNERDDAATTKVTVNLPPLAFVSFEPKEGWKRTVKMTTLDEPIDVFGQELTEVVGSVTWSGGRIGVGEFDEFGFSARTPDDETALEFPAEQTYSSGELVEWTGAPDAETPAALVHTYDIGAGEEEGELAVLAELSSATGEDEGADDDDGSDMLPLALGGLGLLTGLAALVIALRRPAA